jgi:hypothetical protein
MDTTKRARTGAALTAAALLGGGLVVAAGPAQAAYAPVKRFQNCTAMHQVSAYKGGVRRAGATDRRASGGVAKYKPYTSTKTYHLNAFSDRDKDGVACEQ